MYPLRTLRVLLLDHPLGTTRREKPSLTVLPPLTLPSRSLSDRLVAKYEAHERLLLQSLSEAESGGRQSISSLQAEIVRIERDRASEISSRDEELSRRQARVEELETALSEEQQWRRFESRNSGTELRSLKQEVARLEVEVDREKKERAQDAYHLGIQLATASAEAGNSTKGFDQKLREAQVAYAELQERSEGLLAIEKQQNRAKRKELEQQLAAALASKQKREGELLRVLDSLQADKETMELKLNTQLKRLEAVKEQEKAVLRARVDRLSKLQVSHIPPASRTPPSHRPSRCCQRATSAPSTIALAVHRHRARRHRAAHRAATAPPIAPPITPPNAPPNAPPSHR